MTTLQRKLNLKLYKNKVIIEYPFSSSNYALFVYYASTIKETATRAVKNLDVFRKIDKFTIFIPANVRQLKLIKGAFYCI